MPMLRASFLGLILLLTPLAASADVLGLDLGAYLWRAGTDGTMEERGEADLEDDLGLGGNESNVVLWAALEHPLPGLPNIKLQYTPIDVSGRGSLDQTLSFDGLVFPAGEAVRSELRVDQLDVIFYWELLDQLLALNLGVNVKVLNGELRVTALSGGERYHEDLPTAVPLLYLHTGFALPAGLGLDLEASGIAYDGDRYLDLRAGLAWRLSMLELQIGYRLQQLQLDDLGGADVDIEIAGLYAGAALRF